MATGERLPTHAAWRPTRRRASRRRAHGWVGWGRAGHACPTPPRCRPLLPPAPPGLGLWWRPPKRGPSRADAPRAGRHLPGAPRRRAVAVPSPAQLRCSQHPDDDDHFVQPFAFEGRRTQPGTVSTRRWTTCRGGPARRAAVPPRPLTTRIWRFEATSSSCWMPTQASSTCAPPAASGARTSGRMAAGRSAPTPPGGEGRDTHRGPPRPGAGAPEAGTAGAVPYSP